MVNCNDKQCSLVAHREAIDLLCDQIIECCISAERQCIPQKRTGARPIPGWNAHVEDERQRSLFWHDLWLQAGRPMQGPVYDVMKLTRKRYHYAKRYCKSNAAALRREKIAESSEHNLRDFWTQVRRACRPVSHTPATMDGVIGSANIAKHFASKYENLYQSVPTLADELTGIENELAQLIQSEQGLEDRFTSADVLRGVRRLKARKGDGNDVLYSDHLINGGGALHHALSMLFNCMLVHGYSPPVLLASVMISIPKDRRASLCVSSNYRSIALSSSIGKLLEIVILMKYINELSSSELQFGFKPNHSTVMCTAVLKEIVQYFNNRGSNVYAVFLDASKAFDRVHYGKLFELLIKRELNPSVIRMLLYTYVNQNACVNWNGIRSSTFRLHNGVKQGGVLSPVLFTVYIESLLSKLKSLGVGCSINGIYSGALCYADDITLICPSLHAMNRMLRTCYEFGQEFDLMFNAKKTVAMYFGSIPVSGFAELNGCKLEWQDRTKHLGNYVTSPLVDDYDCKYKTSHFIGSVNKLTANFGSMYSHIKWKLFVSYCTSFYGSQMWLLSCRSIPRLYVQWNKAVRRVMGLPARSHTWALGPLHNSKHIRTQLEMRTIAFICRGMSHMNPLVRTIFMNALTDARSDLGANIAFFRAHYSIRCYDDIRNCVNRVANAVVLSDEQRACVEAARELVACREGFMSVDMFEQDDIQNLLETVLCA